MQDDPTYPAEAFLLAHDVVQQLSRDMEIQFQVEGLEWDRATMQKHVNSRGALIHVQKLLLDEGERLAKAGD